MNLRESTRDHYSVSQITKLTNCPVASVAFLSKNTTAGVDARVPKYPLSSLPGEYSALHMVSIMVAAFQQFAPGTVLDIDLAREYEAAVAMRG